MDWFETARILCSFRFRTSTFSGYFSGKEVNTGGLSEHLSLSTLQVGDSVPPKTRATAMSC